MQTADESRDYVIVKVKSDNLTDIQAVYEDSPEDIKTSNIDKMIAETVAFETYDACAEYITDNYDQTTDGVIRPYGVDFVSFELMRNSDLEIID